MPKIIVRPDGPEIEVDQDTDLLSAFKEADVYVKSSCGGHASCSDCIIKILGGEDYLSPPPFEEIQLLGNVFHITKERLACQIKISGDVVVDLSGHDKGAHEAAFKQKQKQKVLRRKPGEKPRQEIETKKKEDDTEWVKHWEKERDPNTPKKLGGNRRPKPFKTPEETGEREEKEEKPD